MKKAVIIVCIVFLFFWNFGFVSSEESYVQRVYGDCYSNEARGDWRLIEFDYARNSQQENSLYYNTANIPGYDLSMWNGNAPEGGRITWFREDSVPPQVDCSEGCEKNSIPYGEGIYDGYWGFQHFGCLNRDCNVQNVLFRDTMKTKTNVECIGNKVTYTYTGEFYSGPYSQPGDPEIICNADIKYTEIWAGIPIVPEGVVCKTNNPPIVSDVPKVVYVKEKDNSLSISKIDEKSGKMKINSLIYNTVISDGETKVEDLKLQIGSSKIIPVNPAAQVAFSSADIGLVFAQLPKVDKFIFKVEDDGTTTGQTERGEFKSANIDTKVLWCPSNINLYAAYDLGLQSNGKQTSWGFGFNDGETVIQKSFKEMTSTLEFTNDAKTPLKGEFHVHILNQRASDLKYTLETVDTGRSRAIVELQSVLEKVIGQMDDKIAYWGCKKDKWGSYKFKDGVTMVVCKEYGAETIDYDIIYSFEKNLLTVSGGTEGNIGQLKMSVPLDKFISIINTFADNVPDAAKDSSSTLKIGWLNSKDWRNGGLKPSEMVAKTKSLLSLCVWNNVQAKVVDAEKDKTKKTITTTGKKSYYYIKEYPSKEDSAIKIILDVPLLGNITKIFNYSQINFTDEDSVSLYRYEDNEIEDSCYTDVLSETNFSVTSAGGNFSIKDLEIAIPENAIETNGTLTIRKVNVTNCIKDIDTNLDEKISLKEILSYLKNSIIPDEPFISRRIVELLLRWRIG